MKHTDFLAQTRAIKALEYKELYAAIEAHGGFYKWDLSCMDHPIIAVNVSSICPNPMDIEISQVSIDNGVLKLCGEDKEYGNDIDFAPEDAFAGHLSFIIDHIPPTDKVEDVTYRQSALEVSNGVQSIRKE